MQPNIRRLKKASVLHSFICPAHMLYCRVPRVPGDPALQHASWTSETAVRCSSQLHVLCRDQGADCKQKGRRQRKI